MTKGLASFPLWKAFLGGAYLSLFFGLVTWLFNSLLLGTWRRLPNQGESLVAVVVFPLYLSLWWASKRGKARMLWLSNLGLTIYVVLLLMTGAIRYLVRSLSSPWNWIVAGFQVLLAVTAVGVGLVAPGKLDLLHEKILDRLWILVALVGGGGAGGALIGMYAARYGQWREAYLLLGITLSILSLTILTGSVRNLWRHRPWAKEEEG